MLSPVHPQEATRLACLRSLNVLDSPPDVRFDDLASMATELMGCPSAFVSFIDDCRLWFKAKIGLDGIEVPREQTFCAHAIASGEPLVVPDARLDPRFADHPFVTGDFGLRFYASMPIFVNELPVGTICVFDRKPRRVTDKKLEGLRALARQATALLEARQAEDRSHMAERRFLAFMGNSPSLAFLKDADGRMRYVNERFEELFGIEPGEVLGLRDEEWLPAELAKKTTSQDERVRQKGRVLQTIERFPDPKGSMREWSVQKFPVAMEEGSWVGGIAVDVTELREAKRAAQMERDFSEAVIEAGGSLVCVVDRQGRIVRFNAQCEQLTGWDADEVLGMHICDVVYPPEEREGMKAFLRNLTPADFPASHESRWITRNGDRRLIEWRSSALLDDAGELAFSVNSGVDMTVRREQEETIRRTAEELKEMNVRLEELATTDELTGIANHRAFRNRLALEMLRVERSGQMLSLAMLDVDKFKTFNDELGHQRGDETLRGVARVLSEASRDLDLVARYGGEEFVVLMPGAGPAESVMVAERLRAAIEDAEWPYRGVTASFGVATLTLGGTGDSLIGEADRAMYASKAAGRNRVTHAQVAANAAAA